MCMHCRAIWSIEKVMYVIIKAQEEAMRQMNDKQIWKNYDDPDCQYLVDKIGKLHCLIENIDL